MNELKAIQQLLSDTSCYRFRFHFIATALRGPDLQGHYDQGLKRKYTFPIRATVYDKPYEGAHPLNRSAAEKLSQLVNEDLGKTCGDRTEAGRARMHYLDHVKSALIYIMQELEE